MAHCYKMVCKHSLNIVYIMSTQIAGVLCKILTSVQAHFLQCALVTYTINYDIIVTSYILSCSEKLRLKNVT